MRKEVLIFGRGGQGILLMGHVIGVAAAKHAGLYVTSTESYSSEMRGGESRSDLIIADSEEELDYVKVRNATDVIAMYPPRLGLYEHLIGEGALVQFDTSFNIPKDTLRPSWVKVGAPYTRIAEEELGTPRVANMVALGHFVRLTNFLGLEAVEAAIEEVVKKRWIEINRKALRRGYDLGGVEESLLR